MVGSCDCAKKFVRKTLPRPRIVLEAAASRPIFNSPQVRIVLQTATSSHKVILLLEMFVRGALILADADSKVIFRSVTFVTTSTPVGVLYPFNQPAMRQTFNYEKLLCSPVDSNVHDSSPQHRTAKRPSAEKCTALVKEYVTKFGAAKPVSPPEGAPVLSKRKKKKQAQGATLEGLLLQCLYCANPQLCQWVIRSGSSSLADAGDIGDIVPTGGALVADEILADETKLARLGEFVRRGIEKILCVLASASLTEEEIKELAAVVDGKVGDISSGRESGGKVLATEEALPCASAEYSTLAFWRQLGHEFFRENLLGNESGGGKRLYLGDESGTGDHVASATSNGFIKCKSADKLFYLDFAPFAFLLESPSASPTTTLLPFPDFSLTADAFFSKLEIQKRDEAKFAKTKKALSKVDRIRADHEERIKKMQEIQENAELKAALLIENSDLVDQCISMLTEGRRRGVDWVALWQEIKQAQNAGHPLAQHIYSIDLLAGEFVILLEDTVSEVDGVGNGGEEREQAKAGAKEGRGGWICVVGNWAVLFRSYEDERGIPSLFA